MKTASSVSASRCSGCAPPCTGSMNCSSGHDQPLIFFVSIARPGALRSMAAGLNTWVSVTVCRFFHGFAEHPRHVTTAGYIQSAPNPSAQSRRVDNTSANTSPVPYFTFTTLPSLSLQSNFAVAPSSSASTWSHTTFALGANAPLPCGPSRMSISGTVTGFQICARCKIANRACSETRRLGAFFVWASGVGAAVKNRSSANAAPILRIDRWFFVITGQALLAAAVAATMAVAAALIDRNGGDQDAALRQPADDPDGSSAPSRRAPEPIGRESKVLHPWPHPQRRQWLRLSHRRRWRR